MPKLDIEKEHEVIKVIEDSLNDNHDLFNDPDCDTWQCAKEILIYLKVRGYEVVKRGEA